MTKTLSTNEVIAFLKEKDNFLLLTHRRPDGDTLGSAGALANGLREIGKTIYILNNPELTPRYTSTIEAFIANDDFTPDCVISIDTATLDLFSQNAMVYKDKVALCIDHHESNTNYAQFLYADSGRAACGELIYELLMEMTGKISTKTAECLYIALSTDTGCFSYANTTAETFAITAHLIEAGAPVKDLNKKLFRTKTRGRIKIEGMITSGIEFHFDDKVAIATITRDMMKASGANEDDIDDISNLPISIEGIKYGITVRELSSDVDCKISCRTVPPYDANELCGKFGGGGHKTAAGASIKKSVDEVKSDLLEVLSSVIASR